MFIVAAIVFSAVPFLHYLRGRSIMDYELWYDTGRHVLAGDEIFFLRSGKYDFMYPPTCALFLAGASLLGQAGLILLLVAINSAAWFCSVRLAAILADGQSHIKNAWVYLIPSLLLIVYIWSSYHLGQPHLVLLALMLGAFVGLRTKREISAGALIAVAAAIKAFPAIAIIYLVYRRYWKAAASLIVTLAFLLLVLPAPFRGFERAWHDLEKWSVGMLKYDATGVAQRPMRSYSWKNQSLVGVGNRLLRHIDSDAAPGPHTPIYVNFADFKFATVNAIVIAIALALGILFVAAMPHARDANGGERCNGVRIAGPDHIAYLPAFLWLFLFLAHAAICSDNATSNRWERFSPFVVELAGVSTACPCIVLPAGRASLRQYIFCQSAVIYRARDRALALQAKCPPDAIGRRPSSPEPADSLVNQLPSFRD